MKYIKHILVISLLSILHINCGGGTDGDNSGQQPNNTPAPTGFSLTGSWGATTIEGSLDPQGNPLQVDASVSTWTFNADGSYTWFLHAPPWYDISGSGNCTLNGSDLSVDGIIADTLIRSYSNKTIPLTISQTGNTFSFLDEDGDRWVYER